MANSLFFLLPPYYMSSWLRPIRSPFPITFPIKPVLPPIIEFKTPPITIPQYFPRYPIYVILLCHNEAVLLPHTVHHYRTRFPSCTLIIYDNESTDDSVACAKRLGCEIISWSSEGIINDFIMKDIKNHCWKQIKTGWIIMADMDEWLCITEKELEAESKKGTTVLTVKGYDIVGESDEVDLSDIDLHTITRSTPHSQEDKMLCFLRDAITDMNYSIGAHECDPKGRIQYSSTIYNNKHMCYLGLPFVTDKIIKRHERAHSMQQMEIATHYTNNTDDIKKRYHQLLQESSLTI